ncbi:hypothetical protein CAPTEDRAFT_139197 [Capitella teleta]|uniref:Hexosyltransferase n=1 Tax=Capitella teleta TaxID=283909 RepID=R7U688_CAPTE|nr:hypothetical protein CAPTEDRAFT_139197 [Capitella teleta]|eukprot:ELU01626.1 hypothetical protein CAPTEDRAFT_139197 [Capitella teleta]
MDVSDALPLSRIFKFEFSPVVKCDFLLVVVHSAARNRQHRDAIRATWASSSAADVVFLIGDVTDPDISESVATETRIHRDVLRVNVKEGYRSLSLKSIAMLQWINASCSRVKYVLKADDDTFVGIPNLLKVLRDTTHSKFIMGEIIAGAKPMREIDSGSKWITSLEEYPGKTYPVYVSGAAYVISGDLVSDLYKSTLETPLFWIEDVFITALCADRVHGKLIFNPKFHNRKTLSNSCLWRGAISVHKIVPEQLISGWQKLRSGTC